MVDTNFIKSVLSKCNIPYPSSIQLKLPQEDNFLLIDSIINSQPENQLELPVFEHDHLTRDNLSKQTFLWLKYPEQVIVVAAFPEDIFLDDHATNILYNLFFPISLEKTSAKVETRFENMVSSIVELSSTVDFNILINKILEKTISLVKADAGMLWVYESDINKLVCKAYKGCATEMALSLQLDLGEGLIGKTFLRGISKLYSTFEEILPDIEDFSAENKIRMQSIFGDHMMDSVFVIPIIVNQQTECILAVYRERASHPFSTQEIELLRIFADLIEMAMTNAKSLITLHAQLDNLSKCNSFYAKLTGMSVNNYGISIIVKELKQALGIPVIVINLMTNEHFPRHAAYDSELFNQLTSLDITDSNTFYIESEKNAEKHCVYPILVGGSCLGYLIARHEENELQINKMILEIGRMVIALEFSKAQSMLDILFKKTSQNFLELINLNNPLDLEKKSNELGLDTNANFAVLVLAADIKQQNNELKAFSIYRLIAKIKAELAGNQKLVFSSEHKITVLLSTQSENSYLLIQQQINKIISQTEIKENLTLYAGMGSLYNGANNICRSYREAQNALSYQLSQKNPGLLLYSEMGINQLFINLTSEEAGTFLSSVFIPLREASKGAEYLENTLVTFVESNCSMTETAKRLFIHTNTLYQRLQKIEDCLDISLKKSEDLLRIKLACYLKNIYPDSYDSI